MNCRLFRLAGILQESLTLLKLSATTAEAKAKSKGHIGRTMSLRAATRSKSLQRSHIKQPKDEQDFKNEANIDDT